MYIWRAFQGHLVAAGPALLSPVAQVGQEGLARHPVRPLRPSRFCPLSLACPLALGRPGKCDTNQRNISLLPTATSKHLTLTYTQIKWFSIQLWMFPFKRKKKQLWQIFIVNDYSVTVQEALIINFRLRPKRERGRKRSCRGTSVGIYLKAVVLERDWYRQGLEMMDASWMVARVNRRGFYAL